MAINNQANVNYTYTGARSPIDTDSNITVTELLSGTSLSIVKFPVGSSYISGDIHSFVIRVTNTGTTPVNDVIITDNLGQFSEGGETFNSMEYVDGTASYSLNNSLFLPYDVLNDNPLTIVVGTLDVGDVYELVYSARTPSMSSQSEITNISQVTGSYLNDTVVETATATITPLSYANVEVVKTQTTPNAVLQEDFSYTLTLNNTGNLEANNVIVTDNLPSEFSLESVTLSSQGVTRTLDSSEYSYENNLLTVPASGSTLSLDLLPDQQIVLSLNGRFTSQEINP